MFFIIFLIALTSNLVSSESQYNNNVLPYVKRKFYRIDHAHGVESRLFADVNRTCVMELLELSDDEIDYSNSTGEYLNLRNDAINKAFEVCTEERKVVLSEEQFIKNLKNHENFKYNQQIDCFKNEFLKIDPDSSLLKNSNLILSEENCTEILEDFELKIMKGFDDYKARAFNNFNLQNCNLEEAMKVGRRIAMRYILIANGNYAYNDILNLKNSFCEDAKIVMTEIVKCYVEEMKAGNFGVTLGEN